MSHKIILDLVHRFLVRCSRKSSNASACSPDGPWVPFSRDCRRASVKEDQYELRPCVTKDLERIKWYLWNGNVFQAVNELQSLEMDLDAAAFESKNENSQKLLKGVEELHTYVERNQEFVPNYGERYRNGERIASGFVESAINQVVSKRMVKKQQMGWSQRGEHLLLQIRTRVLDEEWENTFRRWYPDFRPRAQAKKAA